MKFEAVQNSKEHWAVANGTSLKGYVQVNYIDLEEAFGQPTEGDGYKIDAEWVLVGEDGTVATIYNWKNGYNYCGNAGMALWDIHNWHIGGHSQAAVELVYEALGMIPQLERDVA